MNVAIIDYKVSNLYSVQNALNHLGINKGINENDIPESIKKYIHWTEDIGPYTKLIPCLIDFKEKNVVIITIDDDVIYSKILIDRLYKFYLKFGCVISSTFRQIRFENKKSVQETINWIAP